MDKHDQRKRIQRALKALSPRGSLEALESVRGTSAIKEALDSKRLDEIEQALLDPERAAALADLLPASPSDARGKAAAKELLAHGRAALEKVHRDGPEAPLSEEQFRGLEAIIRIGDRPSFLVQNGDFKLPADDKDPWKSRLALARAGIQRTIRSVGKIQLAGDQEHPWAGTGWVAGADLVLTNAHVANIFSAADEGKWKFRNGVTARINFLAEEGSARTSDFAIEEVVAVMDKTEEADLALLRVATKGARGAALPPPLPISSNEGDAVPEEAIYAVGYPGFDPEQDSRAMEQIFAGIFGRKRLAPGEVMDNPKPVVFTHDCSTLKGSSGSCVVRMGTHQVVGLHFQGEEKVENAAVLLARVKGDKRLADRGLHFV